MLMLMLVWNVIEAMVLVKHSKIILIKWRNSSRDITKLNSWDSSAYKG